MKIIKYINSNNIIIEFQDGKHSKKRARYQDFLSGSIREPLSRVGETGDNKWGSVMKIVDYRDANNIVVEFQDEYKCRIHTSYRHFQVGNVKNPYDRTVYGIGYLGKVETTYDDGKPKQSWEMWRSMIQRCYDKDHYQKIQTSYADKSVCEEWLCYANFEKWFNENWYKVGEERMHLDKDILIKHNKVYSPEACIIVPQRINSLFVKPFIRQSDLPIGVHQRGSKYIAQLSIYGQTWASSYCDTIDEAFKHYKEKKEQYLKEVAEIYKDKIPDNLYQAMLNYRVEITD